MQDHMLLSKPMKNYCKLAGLDPPYSPDLAPTDYHFFRSLAHHLEEKKIDDEKNLKVELANFSIKNPNEFYERGIRALAKRWQQVVDSNVQYRYN